MPPPHDSGSHMLSLGLEQAEVSEPQPRQQSKQQQQQPRQRKSAAEVPFDCEGGDDPSLVRTHGERDSKAARGVAGTGRDGCALCNELLSST